MSKLLLFISLGLAASANAYVYVNHCANYTDKVDYSFISCINRNFDTVETEINLKSEQPIYLYYCSNYGDKLEYFFQSCVNENFRTIERVKNAYFSNCTNFKDKGVDYSYISCINSNFDTVARILNSSIE